MAKKVTKEDYDKVGRVLEKLDTPNAKITMADVNEYFSLHNRLTDYPQEFNVGCPVCKRKVIKQLKEWHRITEVK